MKITWFGHSAYRLEFADTVMIIDPFLSGSPVFDGDVMEAASGATHVALTHGHDDHIGDSAQICRETGATLIWCTTTPVPELEEGRKVGDDLKYNQIAEGIMKANGVLINDLHSHALLKLPGVQIREGDVHFAEPGYAHLANKVALEIASVLPN